MKSALFNYQILGADWLVTMRHALLADEPGLGKSAQTIRAADHLRLKRILVICPAIARINWLREFDIWSEYTRDFQIVERLGETIRPQASLICSFDYAIRNAESLAQPWDLVIIDEVHFLKSVGAKRAKAVLGKGSLVHQAGRVYALSGTPAPNHAGELWLILFVFGVTRLAYQDFLNRYCDQAPTPYGFKVVGTKKSMIPELKGLLSKIMLRRKAEEVLKDLPPVFYTQLTVAPGYVELTPEMTLQVETERQYTIDKIDQMDRLDNQAAVRMLEALAQSISTLRRYNGLQKVEAAIQLIKTELELGLYSKIVVFGIHKEVVRRIAAAFPEAVLVTGDTSPAQRQVAIDSFQNDPKVKIFVGNIKAAGTAITLTAAHQVLFVEQEWTPGDNDQASRRVRRIGQKHFVICRFMSLATPLDEKITNILRKKTSDLTSLLG